jgi:hypothetical protein
MSDNEATLAELIPSQSQSQSEPEKKKRNRFRFCRLH